MLKTRTEIILITIAVVLLVFLTTTVFGQTYATIPFTDNFTAGGTSLSSNWSTSFTNAAGRIEQRNEVGAWPKFTLNNGITAPSGKGMVIYNTANLASQNKLSAMLYLKAYNEGGLSINFNIVDWGTGYGGCMDSLKIYVSNNGGTSYGSTFTLVNLNQAPYNDGIWNNVSVDLSSLATNNSMVLSDSTVVKFTFNLKGRGDTTSPKSGNQMIYMDNFTLTTTGPLPVELVEFKGENYGNYNILSWITASEIDNDFFTLERCEDGVSFIPIGIVNSNNGYSIQHYSYIDNEIDKTYYYRLKQTDYNGATTYFNVEVITIRNTAARELKYTFDIQGREVSKDSHGVIIKIYSDGTAEKVGQ
jgi:hypothetical protein